MNARSDDIPSLYDELGGESKLHAVIHDFVDRVFDDVMIGFFFRKVSRERIAKLEFELASEMLGGPHAYHGRPLDVAHKQHPIRGGHFARRKQILKETLESHEISHRVRDAWLAHTDELRTLITPDGDNECDHSKEEGNA